MGTKLDAAIESARTVPAEYQDSVAEAIAAVAATFAKDLHLEIGPEHRAEIARRFAEPFEPANPADVEAFFARHGA